MEDRIPKWLQYRHEMCCKKGGYCGRHTCMIWRWFHYGDVIFRWVDLHMIDSLAGMEGGSLIIFIGLFLDLLLFKIEL